MNGPSKRTRAHNPDLALCLQGTELFGFNVANDNSIIYREWAPGATEAYLIGDFSK